MSKEPSQPPTRPRAKIKKVAPRTRTKQVDQVDGQDFWEIEIENLIKKVRNASEGLRLHRSRLGGASDSLPDSVRALTIIHWMDHGKLQPLAAAIRNHLFSQLKGLKGSEHELHPAVLFQLLEMIEKLHVLTFFRPRPSVFQYSPRQVGAPIAASAQANLPRISCTRINKLLVRLIRGRPVFARSK